MTTLVKICGITGTEAARAAVDSGADFLGFVHFAKSPRHLSLDAMAELMAVIRAETPDVLMVSVVADPDSAMLDRIAGDVRPDLIQLHGKETPQRVTEIVSRTGLPTIKAIGVGEAGDLDAAAAYAPDVRYLMFDARIPPGAAMPGGLGISFDWTIMRGHDGGKPWFLAGGLTPDNVARAVQASGAMMVDVSSGVESAPGVKDSELISRFLRAAKSL